MINKKKILAMRSSNIIPLFFGCLIKNGNKLKAYKIFLKVLIELKYKLHINPFFFIESIIERTRPRMDYIIKRRGKRIQYIPTLITTRRSCMLAIKWLLSASKLQPKKTFAEKIIAELFLLHSKRGYSYKKQREIYKIVLNNRTYIRYRKKR